MTTVITIIALLLLLLATDLRRALRSGRKAYAWFYAVSYVVCAGVILAYLADIPLYGPSQAVMDLVKALGL